MALAISTLALGGVVWRDRFPAALSPAPPPAHGEAVSVVDVVLDRDGRRFIEVLFDAPVADQESGVVLSRPPAALSPSVGGVWRWKTPSVLRFDASGRLPMATEFTLSLLPVRFEATGHALSGERAFTIRTDQFLLERVELSEESSGTGMEEVYFTGRLHFNYPVNPAELAPRIHLTDSSSGVAADIPVNLLASWPQQVVEFRTNPVTKTPEARKLRLTVKSDLTPDGGNVTLPQDYVEEIPLGSSRTLSVRGIDVSPGETETTLRVTLSSRASAEIAKDFITLDPPVKVRVAEAGNDLLISGPLSPGESYTVRLAEGLPARDAAALPEAWSTKIYVPNLPPSVDFQSEGLFLPKSGLKKVALSTVNVPKVDLVVEKVYLNNLFTLFQYEGFGAGGTTYKGNRVRRSLGSLVAKKSLDIRDDRNRTVLTPLSAEELMGGGGPGLYRLLASRPGEWQAAQRLLLLTDLGLVAKSWQGGFLVWVSSVRDLSAVAGARVRLVDGQNQVMAEGRTDASGLWRAGGLPSGKDVPGPYMVTVEKGGDFSFLLLDRMRVDTTGLDVGGGTGGAAGYSAYMYGERDLYRPGETVRGVVILRDGELRPAPPMPVRLRHRDPLGREGETQVLRTDRRGMASFEFATKRWSPTGRHVLELLVADEVAGQYGFQVEEFVPDRIKVGITPAAAAPAPGEALGYEVEGSYLFGAPGAGLPVETRVRIEDATFAPGGFSGFTFRNDERQMSGREILRADGTLDDAGRKAFSFTSPKNLAVPSTLDAIITARVSEQGGRGVTGVLRRRLHPYPYYLGLRRSSDGYADPGKSAGFEFVAVSPEGKKVASGALRADLFRDRWQTILRRLPNGDYRYESSRDPELVDTRSIPAGSTGGRISFLVPETGAYRMVLTDPATSASTQVDFYASGWGYAPWAIRNPSRIDLELDRDEYEPGQTAKVLVKAPFPGRLLLSVERDRVYDVQIRSLEGNSAELSVPITSRMRPNAYVTATLVRPAGTLEPGAVARAYGAVPLNVNRAANRIDVTVSAPERVRSESPLEIEVHAAPHSALTVAAVDEGILQLISQPTPDPFSFFYRKLALRSSTYDTFSLLLPDVRLDGGSAGGGEAGGVRAQYLNTGGIRRRKPVALWSGLLETDASGAARARFDVPEFQGSLRVMAVSVDGRRFGSGARTVQVRDPIVLTPTLPRFMSLDERITLPVTVRNDTGSDGEFAVTLDAQGPLEVEGDATLKVQVADGAESTVHFEVATSGVAGEVHIDLTAEGNGELSHVSESLGVRPDLPARTQETNGSFGASGVEVPAGEAGWARPGTMSRTVSVGSIPLVQFTGKLDALLHYPYGCLEQTVSTVFPLLYLEDLAKDLDPEFFRKLPEKGSPAEYVQAGIERIRSFRLSDGAFSLWPGQRYMDDWATVYAAHFLVEARRAGYSVDDYMHDGALDYLAGAIRAKSTYGSDELKRVAYSLYVLARAGRPETGVMDYLREKKLDELSPDSKALLAAAFALSGSPGAAGDLAAQIHGAEEVERATGRNLDSTVRNRALLLLALSEAHPGDPLLPDLVERLARDATAVRWWSTQDSAFTLLALGAFLRTQHAAAACTGTLYAGATKVGTFGPGPASFAGITGTEPLRIDPDASCGDGPVYYSVLARGIPTDKSFSPESSGLELRRELLDRAGREIDPDQVRQGDLIVLKTMIRSVSGPMDNVVVEQLLPTGLEVENPRLDTTESLPWVKASTMDVGYVDLRDDRILLFMDLRRPNTWETGYALLRAVTPGTFRLPPIQAEAMYNGAFKAAGERGTLHVHLRDEASP